MLLSGSDGSKGAGVVSEVYAGYDKWQKTLSDAFLRPHSGPTILFVDDSKLATLCPESEDAARNLAAAVRERLRLMAGRSMFDPIIARYRHWQRGPQLDPPPILPVIALTVLAATRMRTDAEARSTNYYLRLAQTICPGTEPGVTETVRKDLREGGAFVDVAEMWEGLHRWIGAQAGAVGVSTIRDHPHYQRIGFPLSQALIRQSDRILLTRFFQALDFAPSKAPDAQTIATALDIWTTAGTNRLSETLMRALSDVELRPLVSAVIEAHARAWDGRVLASDGKQRIRMRLSVDLDEWKAHWLFPIPPNAPDTITFTTTDGTGEVVLTATNELDYYSDKGSPAVEPGLLYSGLQLHGSEFTAEFPPTPVIFLKPDPKTGSWTSTPEMLPYEEYLVAVSARHFTEFERVLKRAATEGWNFIKQRREALISNYALFSGVKFTDGALFAQTLSEHPRLRQARVAPATVPRPRFVRGLPIATTLSSKHYLLGGEPDLLLPAGGESRMATVTLDGRSEQLQASGFPIELRRFVSSAGLHTVEVDGHELTFTTLEEGPDPGTPAGTATIGWTHDAQLSTQGPPYAVVGAHVLEQSISHHVLARRGRDESWLLHASGRVTEISETPPPIFLANVDTELHSPYFEVIVDATAQWLAQRRGRSWRLTSIGSSESIEYDLEIDVLEAWRRACRDSNGAQLWRARLLMAGGEA